jgi:hypothetical protein
VSLAGIPPLLNPPSGLQGTLATTSGVINTVRLLQADSVSLFGPLQGPWGIFDSSGVVPIALADSVVSLHYKKDWRLPNYPIEQGAFQTYNKVEMPFDVIVKLAKGGPATARQEFLANIDAAAESLNLYLVRTPERDFPNCNVARLDYERTADTGRGLITVEIGLIQIRNTAVATFTSTKASSGNDSISQGTVNASPATPPQSAAQALTQ